MKPLWFLVLFSLSAKLYAYDCIGPKDAKTYAVYPHGMDSEKPDEQELANRKTLTNISKTLNIGIAIPREKDKCPNNPKLLCWGWSFNEPAALD